MRDGGVESGQKDQTGGEVGARAVGCHFRFQTLQSTSQDGLSLKNLAATIGRECNIQDARGRGLCPPSHTHTNKTISNDNFVFEVK